MSGLFVVGFGKQLVCLKSEKVTHVKYFSPLVYTKIILFKKNKRKCRTVFGDKHEVLIFRKKKKSKQKSWMSNSVEQRVFFLGADVLREKFLFGFSRLVEERNWNNEKNSFRASYFFCVGNLIVIHEDRDCVGVLKSLFIGFVFSVAELCVFFWACCGRKERLICKNFPFLVSVFKPKREIFF